MADWVEPDAWRAVAARFRALDGDAAQRVVSTAMRMTAGEAGDLVNILDGEGAVFRDGFFAQLDAELKKVGA